MNKILEPQCANIIRSVSYTVPVLNNLDTQVE
jgi:hypothetical protein